MGVPKATLTQAGIPRSQWNAVNRTGDAAFEARLTGQLQKSNYRTPTIYISPQTNPQQHIRGVMKDSVERGAFLTCFPVGL
jgi:hypothetical protein